MEVVCLQTFFFPSQGYICFVWIVEVILYLPVFWYLGYKFFVVHAAVKILKE